MARFGFVGPTYASQSLNADAQRCVNWYVENLESGDGKSARVLYPTPGLSQFAAAPGPVQVRGLWTINNRTFAVIDGSLYELSGAGVLTALGVVGDDTNPVSMVASPQQLAVASAGVLYVFQLQTQGLLTAGIFTKVPVATFTGPVAQLGYSDGFFIVLVATSQKFYVSNPLDATTWQGGNSKIISTFPDNVVSMIVDHREAWLLGAKSSEVEYDSGNLFPFDTIPGGFIEQGCGAQFATVQLDNSIFWIGARNDQGAGIAWRANGYVPVRVSNHAVETAWQGYAKISNARAFAYQDQGHSFWQINFPTAQATWVYDVATGMWHERNWWNATTGAFEAHRAQNHTFAFGRHLVGDRASGTIYAMSIANLTDFGGPIRRLRRAAHVSTEQEWIYHSQLQVDFETGLGPQPPLLDGAGKPRDPMATMRYSDDGGHTWSSARDVACGQAGNFRVRAIYRRLGRARDRVYEITVSDAIPWRVVDAYLKASPGFQPSERLARQIAKVA